ncbi:ABC transporter ATP-binding protein [Pseudarthrobacter oxydans]|jgi:peptide/nickel transport system ATP-binding protein|uniref:Peptide/nickel transport system ATP-binding protein n=1 Tax=Pseudarthrobacter oxydans TaxID=1671 RepID=A0AAW8NDL1_PSEOX|nr:MULTISPECIES: ABC transporter ATP-binding protein [Pseudarthrobacter]MDR6793510.1 peptide/nickel transport system ATP-binding protein [Pseudarthrobacter oxydans]MDR7164674.1 peptide/nickel transport system ATP-binding protein [Pseudarthrobacter oxydans]GKV73599.1 oligopeptide ABC transporter ATP-binding protein OppF [Pseudarthrobacter sp. NCCP-2145]
MSSEIAAGPVDQPQSAVERLHVAGLHAPADAILSVRDLNVRFNTENGVVHAVRGVDFDLMPGKTLGIVGESGSGKSVTSLAIMGLLPTTAEVTGSVRLKGRELLGLSDKAMCEFRGNELAMVFQDPLSSLTPVYTVGNQIIEALTIHNPAMSKQAKEARAVELLAMVGIPSPKERLRAFPHEFSGGMRQRVMIAIAIANNPRVLIADEPTTALDVTIQAQVLEVLHTAQEETGAAVVMITHDLGVVAGMADDIMVMYAGRPVETGAVDDIYYNPRMPYTMGLLGAVPRVDVAEKSSLVPIEGMPPNLIHAPTGCSFAPRCPLATDACLEGEPALAPVPGPAAHRAACIKSGSLGGDVDVHDVFAAPPVPVSRFDAIPREERSTVLQLKDVRKHFPLTKGALLKRRIGTVKAVDGLSFDIREGECFSIVGESGSGKTTTLLEIMEFHKDQDGEVVIGGISNKQAADGKTRSAMRRELQMVFQDPTGALDPRFTVYEVLAEPLQNAGMNKADTKKRIMELMKLVGLQPDHVNRFPNQFSGGQRQRIGIARALAVNPKLVVLDEPVSALDVSVQAGVINLLDKLRAELGLSYLLVAHDLSVVRHISNRVAVMYLGKIVEIGEVDRVFDNPRHPYTRALLSAIPVPDPQLERTRERIILQGDLPSPLGTPKGCNFATRCPVFAALPAAKQEKCLTLEPPLEQVAPSPAAQTLAAEPLPAPDQRFACFFPDGELDEDMLVVHESADHHAP